jgi:hypothetical protein
MQTKILAGLLIVLALVSVNLAGSRYSRVITPSSAPAATAREKDAMLSDLAGYKKWTLVNPVPQLMDPQAALDCRAPIGGPTANDPHSTKYISVYVNQIGRSAMMEQSVPNFPVGSMIVKEKLSEKNSRTPDLLTVMVKHKQGYNTAGGDWEYLVLSGDALVIQSRGKLASCQLCHSAYQHSDSVSRIYLPEDVRRQLK